MEDNECQVLFATVPTADLVLCLDALDIIRPRVARINGDEADHCLHVLGRVCATLELLLELTAIDQHQDPSSSSGSPGASFTPTSRPTYAPSASSGAEGPGVPRETVGSAVAAGRGWDGAGASGVAGSEGAEPDGPAQSEQRWPVVQKDPAVGAVTYAVRETDLGKRKRERAQAERIRLAQLRRRPRKPYRGRRRR